MTRTKRSEASMNSATVQSMTTEMKAIIATMPKFSAAALIGEMTAKFPKATLIEFAAAMHAATR